MIASQAQSALADPEGVAEARAALHGVKQALSVMELERQPALATRLEWLKTRLLVAEGKIEDLVVTYVRTVLQHDSMVASTSNWLTRIKTLEAQVNRITERCRA